MRKCDADFVIQRFISFWPTFSFNLVRLRCIWHSGDESYHYHLIAMTPNFSFNKIPIRLQIIAKAVSNRTLKMWIEFATDAYVFSNTFARTQARMYAHIVCNVQICTWLVLWHANVWQKKNIESQNLKFNIEKLINRSQLQEFYWLLLFNSKKSFGIKMNPVVEISNWRTYRINCGVCVCMWGFSKIFRITANRVKYKRNRTLPSTHKYINRLNNLIYIQNSRTLHTLLRRIRSDIV